MAETPAVYVTLWDDTRLEANSLSRSGSATAPTRRRNGGAANASVLRFYGSLGYDGDQGLVVEEVGALVGEEIAQTAGDEGLNRTLLTERLTNLIRDQSFPLAIRRGLEITARAVREWLG